MHFLSFPSCSKKTRARERCERDAALSLRRYSDNPPSRKDTLKEVEVLLKQACDLVKQMDVEVRGAEGGQSRLLGERARPVREQLKRLQAQFREAQETAERDALLGGAGGVGLSDAGCASRSRLVTANARAQRQTDVIRGALEIAHDTEQVAIDIARELERNRETIGSIRGHISDTSGALGVARNLINSMQKREVQQKVVLGFVAIVLIGVISGVCYFSFN